MKRTKETARPAGQQSAPEKTDNVMVSPRQPTVKETTI